MTTSGPNPGSGPENLGLGQMWSLLVVLEGVYIKRGHINHGFGPDVETFGVNVGCSGGRLHEHTFGLNLSPKATKKGRPLAQTQVLGSKTWVWQMWWSFLVVLDGFTLTLIGFLRFLIPPGRRRSGTPMMLMMLAKGASIISIIGGPFLHFWPPMHPMTPH